LAGLALLGTLSGRLHQALDKAVDAAYKIKC
ncbi:MAG: hypothetical protein H6Q13_2659, partial [Bacteroidetes bacterium]|nr:hypothetical protein [Bacteroidota bacterium]